MQLQVSMEAVVKGFNTHFPVGCECWKQRSDGAAFVSVIRAARVDVAGQAVAGFSGGPEWEAIYPICVWAAAAG